jgi:histidinol dehydrogenase
MALPILRTCESNFEENFVAFVRRRAGAQGLLGGPDSPQRKVQEIIEAVRARGDEAVLELTEKFDGCRLSPERMRVSDDEIGEAVRKTPPALTDALSAAADRIRRFQEAVLLCDPDPLTEGGRTLSLRYRPVDSAGILVPGATASLASSVLMTVVPARVAGVKRIVMVTPPARDGTVSPDRLAAARIAGAHEVYRVFGAQAVAALAFGTRNIKPVDLIAGPGNIYVELAKKSVFGQVGVDMIAGPSEVVVIADRTARSDWVAAELLAQGEHNCGSAVLLTDDEAFAYAVASAAEKQLASLSHSEQVRANLTEFGGVIVARSLDECADISNRLAPEHLVIMTAKPEAVSEKIRHAGAIFLGQYSPVAVGDYVAGPSHCLPTGTTARFFSGLTANSFLKSTSIIRYEASALKRDAASITAIAEAEQLEAHAQSVRLRLKG